MKSLIWCYIITHTNTKWVLCGATYRTKSGRDLVGGGLHDADQRGDEAHLHGPLAALHLGQLLEDVLRQGGHHVI